MLLLLFIVIVWPAAARHYIIIIITARAGSGNVGVGKVMVVVGAAVAFGNNTLSASWKCGTRARTLSRQVCATRGSEWSWTASYIAIRSRPVNAVRVALLLINTILLINNFAYDTIFLLILTIYTFCRARKTITETTEVFAKTKT